MAFPKIQMAAGAPDVFAEIEADRKRDLPRNIDLGIDE